MLLPFLSDFARDREFLLSSPRTEEPSDVYARLELKQRIELGFYRFGQIRLQAIPDDRVQIYFSSQLIWGLKEVDLDNREFNRFCQDLFTELIRLGFIIPAPEEKAPIGFRTENEP